MDSRNKFLKQIINHYKGQTTIPDDELEDLIHYVLIEENSDFFTLENVKAYNHCLVCGKCCKSLNCYKLANNVCSIWQTEDYSELCSNYPFFDNGTDSGLILNPDCNYAFRTATMVLDAVIEDDISGSDGGSE